MHSLAAAEEAIELAEAYGIAGGYPLDESQKFTLRTAMGERADGSWAASTVGDFEPRQAGKNDSLAARELYGLVVLGEKLHIHTAHQAATATESFLRMAALFENWDDLRAKITRPYYGVGMQSIHFRSGARIVYKTRTASAGRGYANADLVVFDEAQHLKAEHVAASAPTMLVNPNAQAWYTGSGGFGWSHNAWRLRRRALSGEGSQRFAYVEHTAEEVEVVDGMVVSRRPDDIFDRAVWAKAHPAYGHRVTDESMLDLYDQLGPTEFEREVLCIWEPEESDDITRVIPVDAWLAVQDRTVRPESPLVFGFDVNPERSWSSIVVADAESLELLDHRRGVGWAVDRVIELTEKWKAPVALDVSGPAGSFLRDLSDRGVTVVEVAGRDLVQACGSFFDRVIERQVRVLPSTDLDDAVAGASKRSVSDAWAWTRRSSSVDVSPLVAATVALWAARAQPAVPQVFAY